MCCPQGHRANSRDCHSPAGSQPFLQHNFFSKHYQHWRRCSDKTKVISSQNRSTSFGVLSTHPFSLKLYFSTSFSGGLQHSCCSRAALQSRRCRRSSRRWRRRRRRRWARRRWWREDWWLEIVFLLSRDKELFSTFSQKLATGWYHACIAEKQIVSYRALIPLICIRWISVK